MSDFNYWRQDQRDEFYDYLRSLNPCTLALEFWGRISSLMKDAPIPGRTDRLQDNTFIFTWSSEVTLSITLKPGDDVYWYFQDGVSHDKDGIPLYEEGNITNSTINNIIPFLEIMVVSSIMES